MNKYYKMYRHYTIKKKSGGVRHIYDPYQELREMHADMTDEILLLPTHSAATAFELGCDPVTNAMQHIRRFVAVCDFKDFFGSISKAVVKENAPKLLEIKNFDSVFLNGGLPQGSTISPYITNRVMYNFDTIIHNYCLKNKIVYTRYADDITFSWNVKNAVIFKRLMLKVNATLKKLFPNELYIKKEKTHFYDLVKGNCAKVTGVNIYCIKGKYFTSAGRSFMRATEGLINKLFEITPNIKYGKTNYVVAHNSADGFDLQKHHKIKIKSNADQIIKLCQVILGRKAWVDFVGNKKEIIRFNEIRKQKHIKSWILWLNKWIQTAENCKKMK